MIKTVHFYLLLWCSLLFAPQPLLTIIRHIPLCPISLRHQDSLHQSDASHTTLNAYQTIITRTERITRLDALNAPAPMRENEQRALVKAIQTLYDKIFHLA